VLHDLDGRIDMIIDGGPTPVGVESTVVDLTVSPPHLLRPGGVSLEQLHAILPEIQVPAMRLSDDEAAPSPGLLSQHYSPRTPMALFTGPAESTRAAVTTRIEEATARGLRVGLLATREQAASLGPVTAHVVDLGPGHDPDTVARRLYAAVRELDAAGLDLILALEPSASNGLWRAVSDRLARAATEHIRVT
jgi:L-threonylcarbamoyladenylate synthase